jgi:hypothetical protein
LTTFDVANIGREEQRKRMILGVVGLFVTAILTVAYESGGAPRWSAVGLGLGAWFAMLCLFQAFQKT